MMSRGFNLSGTSILPEVKQKDIENKVEKKSTEITNVEEDSNIAVVNQGVQTITTKLTNGEYSPIVVQKGVPVKWIIKAEDSELNGCNNVLTIPSYNISKKLETGDNLIEFTPNEEGTITYTCWMGMVSSTIEIVNDISTYKLNY